MLQLLVVYVRSRDKMQPSGNEWRLATHSHGVHGGTSGGISVHAYAPLQYVEGHGDIETFSYVRNSMGMFSVSSALSYASRSFFLYIAEKFGVDGISSGLVDMGSIERREE